MADAGENGDVVELRHDPFETDRVHDGAGGQADEVYPSARVHLALFQRIIERQTAEGLVIARQRHAHHCDIAHEGKPAKVARAKGNRHKGASRKVDIAKFARAAVVKIELTFVPARRVGKAFFMKVLMTGASGQLGGGLLERMPTIPPITPLEDEATTGRPSFAALDPSKNRAFLGDGPTDWRAILCLMLRAEKALS